MGKIRDMGGIGAHSDNDYASLMRFIDRPWDFPETIEATCGWEKYLAGFDIHRPVRLVVFGFDETLTLATFVPEDAGCSTEVGWTPAAGSEWTEEELVQFNFEPPCEWRTAGKRVEHLARTLSALREPLTEWMKKMGYTCPEDASDKAVALAILTRRNEGAIAVLNLLKIAKLDHYFSAIWRLPLDELPLDKAQSQTPNGVYKDGADWKVFEPPVTELPNHKVDVLSHLVQDPSQWLPVMASEDQEPLQYEDVMFVCSSQLVSLVGKAKAVLRFCKVARYDVDKYYTCGMQTAMGGLGAKSPADYEMLVNFVKTSHLWKPEAHSAPIPPDEPPVPFDHEGRSPMRRSTKTLRRKSQMSIPEGPDSCMNIP